MKRRTSLLLAALALAAAPAAAQDASGPAWPTARPIPDPMEASAAFNRAVQRGTRATTGAPGARYWQQWADYRIQATVDPAAKTLAGSETVTYHNRSPDTLRVLVMKLYMNYHQAGVVRNEPAEVTEGVRLARVAVRGQALGEPSAPRSPGYTVDGTIMTLRPHEPVLPGDSVRIEVEWSFPIPREGAAGRMGWSRDNLVYLAYWYPQMAVYEDVGGWHTDPFQGTAEFHQDFGRYEYTVDAPAGWVLMGSGELANPEQALAPAVLERWRRAMRSDTAMAVITPADFGRATAAGSNGRVRWTFRADSVRDVAFSVMRESRWDAARTPVGDRDGDGRTDYTVINAFWRQDAALWRNAVRYAQQSITHHSTFTGIPYPYPHMTSVEGEELMGGGMEYPMMTLIGAYSQHGDTALYSVTSHELAHMWLPMIVGIDETRYGWMDEGTTNFNENEAFNDFFRGGRNAHQGEQQDYLAWARAGYDTELLRWTDYQYPGRAGFASYTKPATNLATLRALLGEEVFLPAYRRYLADWRFKHPKPWDFFNAFNRAAGRDLGWFWSTWYAEAWALDQAVQSVTDGAGGTTITVQDLGSAPMPARLRITRQDGSTEAREVPVDVWLRGARTATVTVPAGSPVVRVEIDPAQAFPDVNRQNNVWTRS